MAHRHYCTIWILIILLASLHLSVQSQPPSFNFSTPEEEPRLTVIAGDILDRVTVSHAYSNDVRSSLALSVLDGRKDLVEVDRRGQLVVKEKLDREVICPTAVRVPCAIWVDLAIQPSQYLEIVRVELTILDVNDHAPTFEPAHVERTLAESSLLGAAVHLPSATDPDSASYAVTRYHLSAANPAVHPFRLAWNNSTTDPTAPAIVLPTGNDLRLELVDGLDRERVGVYRFNVTAYDGGSRSASLSIDVIVGDVNDNAPQFERYSYEAMVSRDIAAGTHVIRVTATDADQGLNGEVRYRLSKRSQSVSGRLFSVNYATGDVTIARGFDSEAFRKQAVHSLVVMATDLGDNALQTSTQLTVRVDSRGEHAHSRGNRGMSVTMETIDRNNHTASVMENNLPGTFLAHVTVHPAHGDNNTKCSLTPPTPSSVDQSQTSFSLLPLYGLWDFKLVATVSLDREQHRRHLVNIFCIDGVSAMTSSAVVTVCVHDVDDNAPVFERAVYTSNVPENNAVGSLVARVSAHDADIENPVHRDDTGEFRHVYQDGKDGERITEEDEGRINGVEGGDSPAILQYSLDSDADGFFRIDQKSGEIFSLISFDRESVREYRFHALASTRFLSASPSKKMDSSDNLESSAARGASPTARCLVRVTITDVDDELPRFARPWYKFDVLENVGSGAKVGAIGAVDADESQSFVYRLDDSADQSTSSTQFVLDPDTGAIYMRRSLDREAVSHYALRVRAVSTASETDINASDSAVVFIRVIDVNDNAPTFIFPSPGGASIWRLRRGNTDEIKVSAFDPDEGANAELRYSIHSSGNDDVSEFRIDSRSGLLTWNRTPVGITANLSFVEPQRVRCPTVLTLRVEDCGITPLFSTALLRVLPPGCDWSAPAVLLLDSPEPLFAGGVLTQFHVLVIAVAVGCCIILAFLLAAVVVCVTRKRGSTNRVPTFLCAGEVDKLNMVKLDGDCLDRKGSAGGCREEEGDEGRGKEGGAYLMFYRGGYEEMEGGAIVLYVKDPERGGAEHVARFKIPPMRESDGSNLYISRGGRRRAESDESNLFTPRGERDTDSGYMDVSSV